MHVIIEIVCYDYSAKNVAVIIHSLRSCSNINALSALFMLKYFQDNVKQLHKLTVKHQYNGISRWIIVKEVEPSRL